MIPNCGCTVHDLGFHTRWGPTIVYCPLHAAAGALLKALGALEWSEDGQHERYGRCRVCDAFEPDGHDDDCQLGAALADARRETQAEA